MAEAAKLGPKLSPGRVVPGHSISTTVGTGHRSSKGHKGYGIDAVFEVDEATQLGSHVTNDRRANADIDNGDHKA